MIDSDEHAIERFAPLSAEDIRIVEQMERFVDAFRVIRDGIMPSSYIRTFLAVAKEPGHGSSIYARKLGMVHAVASRILLELGQKTRWGGPGLMLLDTEVDSADRRIKRIFLTPAGQALFREVLGIYGTEPPNP